MTVNLHRHLDRDGDGRLSVEEVQQLIAELGIEAQSGLAAVEAGDVMAAVLTGAVAHEGITFETFAEFHRKVRKTHPPIDVCVTHPCTIPTTTTQVCMVQALPRVDLETADALRAQQAADTDAASRAPSLPLNPSRQQPSPAPPTTPTAVAAVMHDSARTGAARMPLLCAASRPSLLRRRRLTCRSVIAKASSGQQVGVSTTVLSAGGVDIGLTRQQQQQPHVAADAAADGDDVAASTVAEGPSLQQDDAHQESIVQQQRASGKGADDLMRPTPASSKATVR